MTAKTTKVRTAADVRELSRIGDRIKTLRETAGLTQQDLADLSGIHRVNLSKLENGKLDIGVSSLRRLADALELEPSQLLG